MELALSAVTGDLVSRFISLLLEKCSGRRTCSEEKRQERLQQLLMRVRTIVEEADGRYVTNSGMLAQLEMLADAMYRGHCVLDAFMCRSLELPMEVEVSSSSLLKRSRSTPHGKHLVGLPGALEGLEAAVANMAEFVVLLNGCDRMVRRPYDTYLYTDSFMFGRHAEKQKLLSFLLRHDPPDGAPAVLPIIGAPAVGKKTLVAHVCKDERVASQFSSILHLNAASFRRIAGLAPAGKMLVVVDFGFLDVDELEWSQFYSSVASMDGGSKVVILSRLNKLEKLGTVKPIFLKVLSHEEYTYLFKALAFGSANPMEHLQLVRVADEFSRDLQSDWSLIAANSLADVMRKNLDVRFWLSMLTRGRRVIQRNFSIFGEHPRSLIQRGRQIDMTDCFPHPAGSQIRISPVGGVSMKQELPKVKFGELLLCSGVRPKGEFNLLMWESRMPPYTSFVHYVPSCAQDMPREDTPLSGKKRQVPL